MARRRIDGSQYKIVGAGPLRGFRLLEIVSREGRGLASILGDLPKSHFTPEIRLDCPDDRKFEVVRRAAEFFRKHYEVIDIDGVRVNFADGWGLVRASNTQPVLVLRFEATTPNLLDDYQKEVEKAVEQAR